MYTTHDMLSHINNSTASCCHSNYKMHNQRYQETCESASTKQSNHTPPTAPQRPRYPRYQRSTSLSAFMLLITQSLLLLLLLIDSIAPTAGNPDWMQRCSICHCNWNSGKKTADCKARSLTAIPDDLSNEMQVVDFSNNIIPELRRDEFADANLQNLHKIFLRNCTIQELNRDALKGLTILIELDMSHNFIRELHVGTFGGLEKLRNLVMNHNEIEVLENYLFVDLPFLSRVEFKNNRLKTVEVHAFGQQPMLSAIYLEANALSVLRKETFARIPKLMHLSLAQNPWNCTCELQAFRDFALANRLYTPPTDCAQPPALRGKLWTDIPSENFACYPRILGSVRSFVEVQSDNITLPCRVEGSPRPNVTWIYNRRVVNPNDQRFRILNSIEQQPLISSDPTESITSELRIFNVRASDKGMYTCIAENRGGKAEAEFQLIVDGDFFGALEGMGGGIGASTTDTQSNFLLVICLIVITVLLLLMCVLLIACWYCRRVRSYQKDTTMMSENGLISTKMDKTNSSMLEGSVIMEMQKSLLTEVNPVEKPPRRTELENVDGSDEGHEIKKTLLDESQFGK
ncbi:PREDICTED: immunoglobulin superfamily member 10-like [Rhagoletis zephyria]|uniref:immunoglobulin superfamily member 10-like n=1 Tax=Rhagoletis zephyria TaxID=28612 RepID=UPI0008115A81|nr:PREDICTED: immunoglobulin superfamily member 10-like [Rhagoletis zephyria]